MDIQLVSALIFFALMGLFLIYKRKNIEIQNIFFPIIYFAMYRTNFGIKAMDKFAKKYKRVLGIISYISIGIGFLGMALIVVSLVHNLWKVILSPGAAPGVALVLPFKVKGGFYVPFFYWIISIFLIALVHEFSHGIFARLHGMKIKSSGFAFLNILVPILPAAFVEPDEKQLQKASAKKQLDVFSAGPFSNVLFAFIFLGLLIGLGGPVAGILDNSGVLITGYMDSDVIYPAEMAGMGIDEIITNVDSRDINSVNDFISSFNSSSPGDTMTILTDQRQYEITLAEHPDNKSKAILGVMVQQKTDVKQGFVGGKAVGLFLIWLLGLLYWLFVLNLGIGLFNLAPLGPIDGGRMLLVVLEKYFSKERARTIWKNVSFVMLLLVVANILISFL